MGYPEDCNLSYSYSTPEGLRDYYDGVANYYDLFLQTNNYVLHKKVAEIFTAQWQDLVGSVLDVACGTGKLGLELRPNISSRVTLDGLDFSNNMIVEAENWRVYGTVHNINLKGDLSSVQKYDAIVSSGAFTPGHLDADDLINLRALLHDGGRAFISVKKDHFEENNFAAKLQAAEESGLIVHIGFTEVLIWDSPSFTDTAIVVTFQKSE